jgi:hypothetical protein
MRAFVKSASVATATTALVMVLLLLPSAIAAVPGVDLATPFANATSTHSTAAPKVGCVLAGTKHTVYSAPAFNATSGSGSTNASLLLRACGSNFGGPGYAFYNVTLGEHTLNFSLPTTAQRAIYVNWTVGYTAGLVVTFKGGNGTGVYAPRLFVTEEFGYVVKDLTNPGWDGVNPGRHATHVATDLVSWNGVGGMWTNASVPTSNWTIETGGALPWFTANDTYSITATVELGLYAYSGDAHKGTNLYADLAASVQLDSVCLT